MTSRVRTCGVRGDVMTAGRRRRRRRSQDGGDGGAGPEDERAGPGGQDDAGNGAEGLRSELGAPEGGLGEGCEGGMWGVKGGLG